MLSLRSRLKGKHVLANDGEQMLANDGETLKFLKWLYKAIY